MDDELEEVPTMPVSDGSLIPSESGINNGLLALIGQVSQLSVLLAEADHEEMSICLPRLKMFQNMVKVLNTAVPAKRVIGFGPSKPKKGKK